MIFRFLLGAFAVAGIYEIIVAINNRAEDRARESRLYWLRVMQSEGDRE